jgi:hypothetical protein
MVPGVRVMHMLFRSVATRIVLLSMLALLGVGPLAVGAQTAPLTLRLALVPQWSVNQHRSSWAAQSPVTPELRRALDGGVVDRAVFWWQRGLIQRSSLVRKPIRVLPPEEAASLGGRGAFGVSVRPSAGASAWTQIDVLPRGGDVVVLEVGGELNTITQVLETVLLVPADGPIQTVALARRALVQGSGIPVVSVQFGTPPAVPPTAFGRVGGLDVLVARSLIDTLTNGDTTTLGPADRATTNVGDWREADRVFIRAPAAALQAGSPGLVLVWKDRVLKPDPDGGQPEMRRSRLELPRAP